MQNLESHKTKENVGRRYEELSQDELTRRYLTHGVLLLLDSPEGLEFGIDNISWTVGSKFRGIKFIPLGTHIISYSLKEERNMFKINKFINFSAANQYQVFQWHHSFEMFVELKGQQRSGYCQGIRQFHFDSYLGPFPQQKMHIAFWAECTNYITNQVLCKLEPSDKMAKFEQEYHKLAQRDSSQPQCSNMDEGQNQFGDEQDQQPEPSVANQEIKESTEESKQGQGSKESDRVKGSSHKAEKFQSVLDEVYYSEIPRRLTNQPEHINQVNINKTEILSSVLQKEYKGKGQLLLGELQYCFVLFLIGENQQSFEQWKRLVHLIVNSEDLWTGERWMLKNTSKSTCDDHSLMQKIGLEFVALFYNQLKQFPIDFFVDELSKENFIEVCLKRLKQYSKTDLNFGPIQGSVIEKYVKKIKKRIQKLLSLIEEHFNYAIDSEEQQQNLPTVVDQEATYF